MSPHQRGERAQQAAQANGTEVVPATPPPPELEQVLVPAAPRSPAREELLREVRIRLQAETVSAFSQLLDVPQAEVRTRIQGIVDGVITRHRFAVTRDERQRLIDEMVHDVTGFGPLDA